MISINGNEDWIVSQAQRRPAPESAAFLDGACAGDAALRQRVETRLQVLRDLSAAPDRTVEEVLAQTSSIPLAEGAGAIIGRYKLLEKIGEGGFGVVYAAEQKEPVKRRVALKVIKLGMDTHQVVARFESERQALALMDHPNIAKVLDGGATATGRPYFVMELVRGTPITEHCDKHHLTTEQRLALFTQVCQAIQHAHQKGVIHRDIKPSNILVTLTDGIAVPKVIDFGIAKATRGELTDKTVYTQLQQFIGTPAYMSPEQAEMTAEDIDTRSDIYSLGVLLYELLAGCPPFDPKELLSAGLDAMRRTIREKEPLRPSTRLAMLTDEDLTTTARRHSSQAPRLIHAVKGDLDWIAMKCLEKDRQRRYETANDVAMDIRRYLSGEAVVAAPPSTGYRMRKFARRHTGEVVAVSVVALALVTGVTAVITVQHRAARMLGQKNAELKDANARAEERFRQARSAVDNYFTTVSESKLLNVPGLQPLRKELLESAERYYREFLRNRREDAEVQTDAAKACFRVGWINQQLGRHQEALERYRAATEMYQSLAAAHPDNPEYRRLSAYGYGAQGLAWGELGRREEALAAHQKALAIRQALADEHPGDLALLIDVARTHRNIGGIYRELDKPDQSLAEWDAALAIAMPLAGKPIQSAFKPVDLTGRSDLSAIVREDLASVLLDRSLVLRDLGRNSEGFNSCKKAVEFFETLAREQPEDLSLRTRLADAYATGAMLESNLGHFESAREIVGRALDIRKAMVAANPSVNLYRRALAENLLSLHWTLQQLEREAEALEVCREATAVAETAVAEEPDSGYARCLLAQALAYSANLLCSAHRSAEAVALVRRALEIQDKVARDQPGVPFYQSTLGAVLRATGRVEAAAGNASAAGRALERACEIGRALAPRYPVELRNLACSLALLVPVCEPAKREALREQAVQALQNAVTAGSVKLDELKDADLKPLRELPSFKHLIAQLEQNVTAATAKGL